MATAFFCVNAVHGTMTNKDDKKCEEEVNKKIFL